MEALKVGGTGEQAARCPVPTCPSSVPGSGSLPEASNAAEAAPCHGSPRADPPLREGPIPPCAPSENIYNAARIC